MAFRKFAASRIDEGVCPGGGVKTRFSTCPSAKTSTTSARSGRKADEFDMLDRRFVLGRQHKACTVRDARQRRADPVQHRAATSRSF
jgi:hypothetical protein